MQKQRIQGKKFYSPAAIELLLVTASGKAAEKSGCSTQVRQIPIDLGEGNWGEVLLEDSLMTEASQEKSAEAAEEGTKPSLMN